MREFVFGEYSVDLGKDQEGQHLNEIHKILSGPHLALFLAQEVKGNDLHIKLSILKDDLWPSRGGFGMTDKYILKAEIQDA